jgi:hypothetical protein
VRPFSKRKSLYTQADPYSFRSYLSYVVQAFLIGPDISHSCHICIPPPVPVLWCVCVCGESKTEGRRQAQRRRQSTRANTPSSSRKRVSNKQTQARCKIVNLGGRLSTFSAVSGFARLGYSYLSYSPVVPIVMRDIFVSPPIYTARQRKSRFVFTYLYILDVLLTGAFSCLYLSSNPTADLLFPVPIARVAESERTTQMEFLSIQLHIQLLL